MKFTSFLVLSALTATNAFTVAPNAASTPSTTQLSAVSPGVTSKTADWNMNQISPIEKIEGTSRHTWSMSDPSREMVQVAMQSNGRPINADVELWVGPDWTPVKIHCHSEDGREYPVQTLVGTRNKMSNIEVLNTGPHTMPLSAAVSYAIEPLAGARQRVAQETEGRYMEGGSVYHWSFAPEIDQLQVLLETEGKQLNARIELLNGPNNIKQEFEVFTNNGNLNALFIVFDTPGEGNAIRVKNLAPLEYPCKIHTQPSKIRTTDISNTLSTGTTWGEQM